MRIAVRTVVGLMLSAGLGLACGDEGKPGPGYSDPCDTPMGPVLGCPVAPPVTKSAFTLFDACQKLVSCGILSAEWFGSPVSNTSCRSTDECKEGQDCLPYGDDGKRCYNHRLDYRWCTGHFAYPVVNLCDANRTFSEQELASIIYCIEATPCSSLGLPFAAKTDSDNKQREPDKYTCKDGKTTHYTATICDYGLLRY